MFALIYTLLGVIFLSVAFKVVKTGFEDKSVEAKS
jgi:cytochrome bd-type quinol oxidase subunit 1